MDKRNPDSESAVLARPDNGTGTAPGEAGFLALLKKFWRDFMGQHKVAFTQAAVLMVLAVLLQLPVPLLTMRIIDAAVGARELSIINQLSLALVALVVLRHVFSYIHESVTLRLKETIILEVQSRMFRHIQSLPLSFFSNKHSTYLQSRMMNDSRAIEGALVRTVITVAINALTFVIGAAIILAIHYEVGFVLLFAAIPFAYIRYFANQRMRDLSKEMQEKQATTSAAVSERLAGIATIKAFGQEKLQGDIVARQLGALRDVYVKTNIYGIVSTVGTSFVSSLSITFVMWYGINQVIDGAMTLGEVVGILSLLNFLYVPINNLIAANISIQQATTAIQRIYEFLGERAEQSTDKGLKIERGDIQFKHVHFGYQPDRPIFRDFNLSIKPNETIALIGHSGAGKSSLVRMLLRFYEAREGQVLIDGHDVRDIDLAHLRAEVGIVDQQTFLFTGTVLDNIRLGLPDADMESVISAAKAAHAHDFISALPDGYDTRVGERGMTLSGGECQRIALARMFLRNPRILILDEAVSAVDSQSETYIHKSLDALIRDRTTIVIAHRLSSLLLAKRIVLIDDGVLVEEGTHQELLTSQGAYARLFHQQFQSQIVKDQSPVTA
jgi:ABC-type multidrug transport system fused ATPase/permease subunit